MDNQKQEAVEDAWFTSVLNKKRSAEARLHRKRELQFKRSKNLKGRHQENADNTIPDSRQETPRTRFPLATISPNIPSSSKSVINTLQKTHPTSVVNTFSSSLNQKRTRVVSRRNINNIGMNLKRRFDNVVVECASTSSNNATIPSSQINKLFDDNSGNEDTHDDSSESWSSDSISDMDYDEETLVTDSIGVDAHGSGELYDIGDPVFECQKCGANMWYLERKNKCRQSSNPKFTMCCGEGKVQLPLLREPPPVLQKLLFDQTNSE